MTTTELIKILQRLEFGGATNRPREITFWTGTEEGGDIRSFEKIEISSTGDGLLTTIDFNLSK